MRPLLLKAIEIPIGVSSEGHFPGEAAMGYFLDIHGGNAAEGEVTAEQVRTLLLNDGTAEDEDGTIWFAGGLGIVPTENWKRKRRESRGEWEVPDAPEEEPVEARSLGNFRYSWSTDPEIIRGCIRELLQFCQRHGLRLPSIVCVPRFKLPTLTPGVSLSRTHCGSCSLIRRAASSAPVVKSRMS